MPTSYPFSLALSPESAGPFIRQFVMDLGDLDDGAQHGDDWIDCLQEVIEPALRDCLRQMISNKEIAAIQHDGEDTLPFVKAWNALADVETCNDPESERYLDIVMEQLADPTTGLPAAVSRAGTGLNERAAGEMMIRQFENGRFSVFESTLPGESDESERIFRIDFDGWVPSAPMPAHVLVAEQNEDIAHRTVDFPTGNLIIADNIDIEYFQDHLARHGAANIDGLIVIDAAVPETQVVACLGQSLFLACANDEIGGYIQAEGNRVRHVTEDVDPFFLLPGRHIANSSKTLTVVDEKTLRDILCQEDPTLTKSDTQALIEDFMNSGNKAVRARIESGTFLVYAGTDQEGLLTDYTLPGITAPEVDLHLVISAVELTFEDRPKPQNAPEPIF